ncbi:unnamed protein product, partial [Vitis vinifera]|uniref:Uncharacterized protein n=1 Tax=Vitis vinifera TaxID=29760 RepID=D7SGZ2_VITVI
MFLLLYCTVSEGQNLVEFDLPTSLKFQSFPLEETKFSSHRNSQENHFSIIRSTSWTTTLVMFPALAIMLAVTLYASPAGSSSRRMVRNMCVEK